MTTHKNVADHLGAMLGNGIYDVRMIEDEFGRYGFTYDRETDELALVRDLEIVRACKLGARAPEKAQEQLAHDENYGFLDARAEGLVVDALNISQAVYLLLTGEAPPSLSYRNRGLGFRADVKAITKFLRQN